MEPTLGNAPGQPLNTDPQQGKPLLEDEKSFETISERWDPYSAENATESSSGQAKSTFLQALYNMFRGMVGLSFTIMPFVCQQVGNFHTGRMG